MRHGGIGATVYHEDNGTKLELESGVSELLPEQLGGNELRRLVEDDMVQGPVALNEDEWDDHLTEGHAGHRGWRLLCVVGRDRISMILDENFYKGSLVNHSFRAVQGYPASDR